MEVIARYKKLLVNLYKFEKELDDIHCFAITDVESKIRHLELQKLFGFEFPDNKNSTWYRISDFQCISQYGEKYNRTISWSDDDRQPEDEWLYCIRFSTGPYVFGEDYPEKTFQGFFNELKSFGPKYSDVRNNALYFSPDKAAAVHNNIKSLIEKHKALVADELKERKVAKLKEELAALEDKTNE